MTRYICVLFLAVVGCGDSSGVEIPDSYDFDSRYPGESSSVVYTGQTLRHVLIHDLDRQIAGLTSRIDDAVTNGPLLNAGDVESSLLFYYEFDSSVGGDAEIQVTGELPMQQRYYSDIASDKDLVGKVAGHDTVTDHRDWATEFSGWPAADPDALVRSWFSELESLGLNRQGGLVLTDPDGNQIADVYVTADGRDLGQLIQKFLLGAITLSQGLDDYLDDDVAGKGLLSDNVRDEDKPYTVLEHAWDEGFGYFGASRWYLDHSDDAIASGTGLDVNDDGLIDLTLEFNFGVSVNAAKRDRGSHESAQTDYTRQAFDAFLRGRALIAAMDETPSERELRELREQRDIIARVWQRAISATIIHYINDTVTDMDAFGTADYTFVDHAKHWSELKGFLLGLQFSPRSPISHSKLAELNALVGTAPVLSDADETAISDYRAALLSVRDELHNAYSFEAVNVESW